MRALTKTERRVAIWSATCASLLFAGLAITGVWQFFYHRPEPSWNDYVVGLPKPVPPMSTGMADLHGTLGDLAGIFTLLVGAWVSYRLLARVSRTAVAALGVVVAGLFTGGTIRFNALQRNGAIDAETPGYGQIFGDDLELMITDTRDLSAGSARLWIAVHLVALPMLLVIVWQARRLSQRREEIAPAPDKSWLDRLDT